MMKKYLLTIFAVTMIVAAALFVACQPEVTPDEPAEETTTTTVATTTTTPGATTTTPPSGSTTTVPPASGKAYIRGNFTNNWALVPSYEMTCTDKATGTYEYTLKNLDAIPRFKVVGTSVEWEDTQSLKSYDEVNSTDLEENLLDPANKVWTVTGVTGEYDAAGGKEWAAGIVGGSMDNFTYPKIGGEYKVTVKGLGISGTSPTEEFSALDADNDVIYIKVTEVVAGEDPVAGIDPSKGLYIASPAITPAWTMVEMTVAGGTVAYYTVELVNDTTADSKSVPFGIGNPDWDTKWTGTDVTVDGPALKMTKGAGDNNTVLITSDVTADYTFVVDFSDLDNPTVRVVTGTDPKTGIDPAKGICIAGAFTGATWPMTAMTVDAVAKTATYTATDLTAGSKVEFGIGNPDWSSKWVGATATVGGAAVSLTRHFGSNNSVTLAADGDLTFTVDFTDALNPTIKVSQ